MRLRFATALALGASIALSTPATGKAGAGGDLNFPEELLAALPNAAPGGSRATSNRRRDLRAGVQLPRHPAYRLRDPSRAYGTPETVDALLAAFDSLLKEHPEAPRVMVHDLSLETGGPMRGHRSHRTGHDVDVVYYQLACRGPCEMKVVTPASMDAELSWSLIKNALATGRLRFAFVDYDLQAPLWAAAKADGLEPDELNRVFQFPAGPETKQGIIRHVENHRDHMHLRFRPSQTLRTAARPYASDIYDLLVE